MNSVQQKAIQQEAADAARSGNASRLRDCLTRGANLWYDCVFGFALESGDVATFQTILDFGADINEDMGHNGTPLIAALRHNHHELLEFLFSKGVDPNKGHWGHWLPPLSVAVRFTKDIKWVQRLLEAGAKVKESGALHFAAFQSDLARMKLLLDYGADVNEIPPFPLYGAKPSIIHTKKGTPVHWAIADEHLGLCDSYAGMTPTSPSRMKMALPSWTVWILSLQSWLQPERTVLGAIGDIIRNACVWYRFGGNVLAMKVALS